jgi:hypothetical protein
LAFTDHGCSWHGKIVDWNGFSKSDFKFTIGEREYTFTSFDVAAIYRGVAYDTARDDWNFRRYKDPKDLDKKTWVHELFEHYPSNASRPPRQSDLSRAMAFLDVIVMTNLCTATPRHSERPELHKQVLYWLMKGQRVNIGAVVCAQFLIAKDQVKKETKKAKLVFPRLIMALLKELSCPLRGTKHKEPISYFGPSECSLSWTCVVREIKKKTIGAFWGESSRRLVDEDTADEEQRVEPAAEVAAAHGGLTDRAYLDTRLAELRAQIREDQERGYAELRAQIREDQERGHAELRAQLLEHQDRGFAELRAHQDAQLRVHMEDTRAYIRELFDQGAPHPPP